MTTRSTFVLTLALLLTGCGGAPPEASPAADADLTSPAGLPGRTFLSTGVTVDGIDRPLVPGTRIRLSFDQASLSVSAGCNILGADYRLEGGRLVVGPVGGTEMGCDPALHAQDQWLSELLAAGPTISLDGHQLTLVSGATRMLLLDRKVAEPDLPLVGTTWVLTTLIEGEAAMSVPGDVPSTIVFADDGTLSLEPGCNTGGGHYEVVGDTIRFSDVFLTRMACPGPRGEVEAAVVTVISGNEVQFRIDSATLTLQSGNRGLQYSGR